MKDVLARAGVPCARQARVTGEAAALDFASSVGFPLWSSGGRAAPRAPTGHGGTECARPRRQRPRPSGAGDSARASANRRRESMTRRKNFAGANSSTSAGRRARAGCGERLASSCRGDPVGALGAGAGRRLTTTGSDARTKVERRGFAVTARAAQGTPARASTSSCALVAEVGAVSAPCLDAQASRTSRAEPGAARARPAGVRARRSRRRARAPHPRSAADRAVGDPAVGRSAAGGEPAVARGICDQARRTPAARRLRHEAQRVSRKNGATKRRGISIQLAKSRTSCRTRPRWRASLESG